MENKVTENQCLVGATVYILKYTAIQSNSILCGSIGVYATERRAINIMGELTKNLIENGYMLFHRSNLERALCKSKDDERRLFIEPEIIH